MAWDESFGRLFLDLPQINQAEECFQEYQLKFPIGITYNQKELYEKA